MVQYWICPVWAADNLVDVLKEHLMLLVERYVPTKVMASSVLLVSSTRHIFGGPVVALGLTGKSLSAVK